MLAIFLMAVQNACCSNSQISTRCSMADGRFARPIKLIVIHLSELKIITQHVIGGSSWCTSTPRTRKPISLFPELSTMDAGAGAAVLGTF